MNKGRAFLFPGQGAQAVGMGRDFYDAFSVAREVFEEADSLLSRHLSKIIFEGPIELLTETRNSQTGLYVMSIAILRVLQQQFPALQPTVCAGLSLGEYTALTAALRLPFSEGLPFVQLRGEAMQEACLATPGSMAVVLGLSAEQVDEMVKEAHLPNDLWVANYNSPGQIVLSGTLKGIERGMELAKASGAKRVVPLKVQGAFHSGLMLPAEKKLGLLLKNLSLVDSQTPVVMNFPGAPVSDTESIRDFLRKQVTGSVRWEQGIRSIEEEVDLFLEIGCGKTLTGLNQQIGVKGITLPINKVSDLEQLSQHIG